MVLQELDMTTRGELIIDQRSLENAGLGGRVRLIIRKGEIRILPETTLDPKKVLKELAGCLGQEAAEKYDFHLKIGGYYEAR